MSLPLAYTFYRITQGNELADINVADKQDPAYKEEIIASCFSDYFIMFGPRSDTAIRQEALTALLKLARFVEEGEVSPEKAQKVNSVGVERLVASFNELAEALKSGEITLEDDERKTIAQHFPSLTAL